MEFEEKIHTPYPEGMSIIGPVEDIAYYCMIACRAQEDPEFRPIYLLVQKGRNAEDIVPCPGRILSTEEKNQAFVLASKHGHLLVVHYFAKLGADVSVYNDALTIAAANGHLDVVRYLHEVGADIHGNEESALMAAVKNRHLQVARWLLTTGRCTKAAALFSVAMEHNSHEIGTLLYDTYKQQLNLSHPFLQRLEQDKRTIRTSLLPFAPYLSSMVAKYY